jgi:hypothetical protein
VRKCQLGDKRSYGTMFGPVKSISMSSRLEGVFSYLSKQNAQEAPECNSSLLSRAVEAIAGRRRVVSKSCQSAGVE